jgi:hypothetical protein
MKKETYYRIAVNEGSELYQHIEPCGTDLAYAEKKFEKIKSECEENDAVELQKTDDYETWQTVK